MIKLETPCSNCIHREICKNKNQAFFASVDLKTTVMKIDGQKVYTYEDMSSTKRFDVSFKCRDFISEKGTLIR